MAAKRRRTRHKPPQQARSRETVRAILEAAARVLSRDGYDGASTNRIAEVAGVSIGSLYQFFPNKESIFAALRERFFEQLKDAFAAEVPRIRELIGQRESVRPAIELVLRVRGRDSPLQRALDAELPFLGSLDATLYQLALDVALELFEGLPVAVRPPNLELASRMTVTVADAVTRMASVQYPEYLESEEFLDEVTELLWRYCYREDQARRGC